MSDLIAINPVFLWLLPLAALPVIFHLFFRVRKRTRVIPSLMFFHKADPRMSARKKLREWLALLLRVLAILFLLLALARLVWLGRGGGGEVAAVLVIDNSGSMSAVDSSGASRLDLAMHATGAMVADLQPADVAGIVLLVDDPVAAMPDKMASDRDALQAALDRIEATQAHGTPGRALARAALLLDGTSAPRREIHIFSDLQRHEWMRASASPAVAKAGTRIMVHRLPPPELNEPNAAITDVELPRRRVLAGRRYVVRATLVSTGSSEARVRVHAETESAALNAQAVTVPPGEPTPVLFRLPPQSPGLHHLKVSLAQDGFVADDVAYLVYTCRARETVLLAGAAARFGALQRALAPAGDGTLSGLMPRAEPLATWPQRLAADPPALAVLTWADLASSAGQGEVAKALEDYVSAGGNLLVAPSAGDPDAHPGDVAWLGAAPGNRMKSDDGAAITVFEPGAAIWDDLRDPQGAILLGQVKAFTFMPLSLNAGATAQLGLEDGTVLMAETRVGKGSVFACGFAFDPAWTTLPLKASMLAVAQGMSLMRIDEADHDQEALVAGQSPLPVEATGSNDVVEIHAVTGGPLDWRGPARRPPVLARPGVYRSVRGGQMSHFAVRCSSGEGRFEYVGAERVPVLGDLAHQVHDYTNASTLLSQVRRDRRGVNAFLPFLLLALVCLLLESWVVNPVPRGMAPGAAGTRWRRWFARLPGVPRRKGVSAA